jgi:DNA-binding MarR family transcriptional regulator
MGLSTSKLTLGERRLLRAYLRAVMLAEPLQRELATRHGLSLVDLNAVRTLARVGECPVSQYGAALSMPRSTITNLVDRLERVGLVQRRAHPSDRRVTLVGLSGAGERAVDDLAFMVDSEVAKRLFSLDAVSQVALAELLEQLAETGAREASAAEGQEAE